LAGGDTTIVSGDISYDASTKRSSNLTPFDKISKSGDNGGSGDIFHTEVIEAYNNKHGGIDILYDLKKRSIPAIGTGLIARNVI
jgi:hypothetical protein